VQRYKRSFVTVHKKAMIIGTAEKGVVDLTEDAVARKFAEYLEENLRP
jgi:protein KTI12